MLWSNFEFIVCHLVSYQWTWSHNSCNVSCSYCNWNISSKAIDDIKKWVSWVSTKRLCSKPTLNLSWKRQCYAIYLKSNGGCWATSKTSSQKVAYSYCLSGNLTPSWRRCILYVNNDTRSSKYISAWKCQS